jgi:SAM-dependent methyltransferase
MVDTFKKRQEIDRRKSYDAKELGWPEKIVVPLLKERIQFVFDNLIECKNLTPIVLDVGCGSQPLRQALEDKGYKYVGLDTQQNQDCSVDIVSPIDALLQPVEPEQFDLIICTEVLEHVADWDGAFKNMHSLLVSGGKLFITCPHFYNLHEEPYDFWRPTPYAIKHFCEKYGFQIIHLEQAGNEWDVLGTLLGSFHISTMNNSLSNKILRSVVVIVRRLIYKLLVSGFFQRNLAVQGKIYLSNVAVLSKI